jgi:hypothetical protein
MPDPQLLALAREARERAEEAATRAETFHDPEAKRIMRDLVVNYERLARWLEMEGGAET